VPTFASGLAWSIRIVGSVTYSEREENLTQGRVLSDVPEQVRAFDVTTLVTGGACQSQGSAPRDLGTPITFVQNAPAGPGRRPQPTLRVSALAGNFSPSERQGWSLSALQQSTFGRVGPSSYLAPAQNHVAMTALERFTQGLAMNGISPVVDTMAAVWLGGQDGAGEAVAQAFVESTRSMQELAGNYYVAFAGSGGDGTLSRSREGCLYVARRTFAVGFVGRLGASEIVERRMNYAGGWSVEMQLVRCVAGGSLRGSTGPEDPRVIDAAERLLRGCKGCGER
jgi:hypothetical protein